MMKKNKVLSRKKAYWAFFKNIKKSPSGCWEWEGSRDDDGYGQFYSEELKVRRAHRASYKLFIGVIPEGLCVLHSCDNPPCCNPEHLRIGTGQDNATDRVNSGHSPSGFKNGRCKLSRLKLEYIINQRGKVSSRDLARIVNLSRSQIYNIWNGEHKYEI